ncbi:D-glycerate dehydrogenase [Primorskyibacter aestuariivivens]|uniref:2-hydroxyacid dehydrogenase n=1 Tax=Primorskyibacter aestuariivivens TaxID=1888912 RepID=UPI002300ED37|nr:D-glycerate dehydrogenase [Primorskyibacter aestuariivivens]MDA7429097.1 D-glycerate dehydrogenase [Primorskyibacter aestuariivivens]
MSRPRLKVIVTRRLPKPVEKRLAEFFDVTLRDSDEPMTRTELVEAVQTCDVLVPTLNDRINSGLIGQAAERLKLIANYGAGIDHIDVHTARQNGILVSNTPDVLTDDTADMTMALILAVTRRLPDGLAKMQSGDWQGWSPTDLLGRRITGRRLGIIGMGRIGQAVATRARAFSMQIHYHDRQRLRPVVEEGIGANYWEDLDDMIAGMDVISINCPYTTESYHLMNARRLRLMKPDAVIVNTSRGELIDEGALTRMISRGAIAGAGLDVFEHRSAANPDLKPRGSVVLMPHMGSATVEGRLEMGERVVLNIKTFHDGHRPPDQVIPSMV